MGEDTKKLYACCPVCTKPIGRSKRIDGLEITCPKCNSGGRCLDCTGGKKESRCRECGGSGRMLSEHKCQNVIEENIAGALRICRGEE